MNRRPKLLFLVTEDWYFWSHRLPVARAARDAGFDVVVATRIDRHGDRIRGEGFRLAPLSWRRRSLNPHREIHAIAELVRLYRRERPDIVHHVALKPAVYGGLAAWLTGVPAVISALAGFGYAFTANDARARLARAAMKLIFRVLFAQSNGRILLQNRDDLRMLMESGLVREDRAVVIRGSGIDIRHYQPLPEPPDRPITIATVTRMLSFKGVPDLVAASRLLRARGIDHVLLLAGAPDLESPAAISEEQLRAWAAEPGVRWLGHVDDVRLIWRQAHIAVLSSRGGEGLPKSLLEAAACGRPIVATDIPGCREIVEPDVNGFLVPPGDPRALADALATLIHDDDRRRRLGAASRLLVESDLAAERIGERTVQLYRKLLANHERFVLERTP